MKSVVDQTRPLSPTWLRWLVVFLLVVGVVFRFVNLNHKVYGHDEVYTALRASGYTVQGATQELFQNQVFPAKELLRFQRLKPGSTPVDAVRSLAVEAPQQPPLYFLLDRLWVQSLGEPMQALFGSPLTASRLLPAVISLLSLPFMYALAWELFASHAVSLLATAFLALSPVEILFAQTACQSSLLTLAVIASHYLLLRASRLSSVPKIRSRDVLKRPPPLWQHWGWYTLITTLGLYTQPLFALTLVGHAIWIVQVAIAPKQRSNVSQIMTGFWLSLLIAIVLYAPWIFVLVTNVRRIVGTLDWTVTLPSFASLAERWIVSLTALFLDLNVGDNAWVFGLRLLILGLIAWAFYTLYQRDKRTWLFVFTAAVPVLVLMLSDVVLDSSRSTISRYLLLGYPGVQLAIADRLVTQLAPKPHYLSSRPHPSKTSSRVALRLTPYSLTLLHRWFWRFVLLALFTASLASCTLSAASNTWWHEGRSYFNAAIARHINAEPSPLLLSDVGDDSTNLSNLVSLSYRLNSNVRMLLLNSDANWVTTQSFTSQTNGSTIITLHPSQPLRRALERSRGSLQPLLPEADVWQVPAL